MANGLDFPAKVGLDRLFTGGILGGDIQEFLGCARGLMAEHMDEGLIDHAIDEGINNIGVGDVGELIALLGMEVAPAADAAGLELLETSSGRARQKQRMVLNDEVAI